MNDILAWQALTVSQMRYTMGKFIGGSNHVCTHFDASRPGGR